MKPYYFIEDVIKQLEGFDVGTVHFELRVGGNGVVGDGDSLMVFDLNVPKKKAMNDKDLEKMLTL